MRSVRMGSRGFRRAGHGKEMLRYANFCNLSVCYNTFKTKTSKCYLVGI